MNKNFEITTTGEKFTLADCEYLRHGDHVEYKDKLYVIVDPFIDPIPLDETDSYPPIVRRYTTKVVE